VSLSNKDLAFGLALDGPVGWIIVAAVAGVVIYVIYSKAAAQEDQIEAQIQGDIQGVQCWFTNSCVVADIWKSFTS
jgi:hypothetical protein